MGRGVFCCCVTTGGAHVYPQGDMDSFMYYFYVDGGGVHF